MAPQEYDAIVIGAGPNGLAAALRLAEAGISVLVLESAETIGGGTRTLELTLPDFHHDVCSAVHPLAMASPYFRSLNLSQHGLQWVQPEIPLAHPFDDGSVAILDRSIDVTAAALGPDGNRYLRLMAPFVEAGVPLFEDLLAPLHWPSHLGIFIRFGLEGLVSAQTLARRFSTKAARALLAGLAAHSMLPLDAPLTSAIGLVLGILAHQVGWPFAREGSQAISIALADKLASLGGQIKTNIKVRHLDELPKHKAALLNLTPKQALLLVGDRFSGPYRRQLERYRYGPGVFKMDFALDGPIPWKSEGCWRAGTLHLGGTFEEIADAEKSVWKGIHPDRPFVLLTQPTNFDTTRAPEGKHIAWAYCHVPHGSDVDMSKAIESQIERFAPGFKERVLARHVMTAEAMEAYNPNYVGGDINAGVQDWRQLFARPTLRRVPYSTPDPSIFICSSATPPGGGVHGMSGYHAADAVIKQFRSR